MKKNLIITALIAVSVLSAMDAPEKKSPNFSKGRGTRNRNRFAKRLPGRLGRRLREHNAENSPTAALELGSKSTDRYVQAELAIKALQNVYSNYKTSSTTIKSALIVLQLDNTNMTTHEQRIIFKVMLGLFEKYEDMGSGSDDEKEAMSNSYFKSFWNLKQVVFTRYEDYQKVIKDNVVQTVQEEAIAILKRK